MAFALYSFVGVGVYVPVVTKSLMLALQKNKQKNQTLFYFSIRKTETALIGKCGL
jgi:hypothetical protein